MLTESVVEERKGEVLSEQKAYVAQFNLSRPWTTESSNAMKITKRVLEKGKSCVR